MSVKYQKLHFKTFKNSIVWNILVFHYSKMSSYSFKNVLLGQIEPNIFDFYPRKYCKTNHNATCVIYFCIFLQKQIVCGMCFDI